MVVVVNLSFLKSFFLERAVAVNPPAVVELLTVPDSEVCSKAISLFQLGSVLTKSNNGANSEISEMYS